MKGSGLNDYSEQTQFGSNGVGIKAYMHSLKETLQDLTQLPENHWLSV